MGFLDKLKNTFFEEEYVEVEEKPKKQHVQIKKEIIQKPTVREEVKEEIVKPQVVVKEEPVVNTVKKEEQVFDTFPEPPKEEVSSKNNTFNYFDEEDFYDYRPSVNEEVKKEEPAKTFSDSKKVYDNPVYGTKKINNNLDNNPYTKNDPSSKRFTPTPIISPIYGVLDKNYTKDEVQERKEIKPTSSYVSRKNADLDSIRAKAFGTSSIKDDFNLTDENDEKVGIEIENFEEPEDVLEDNLLYDMTDIDKTPSVDKVTLQDAEEYFEDLGLEYNIDYKDVKLEQATGRRVTRSQPIEMIEEDDVIIPDMIEEEVVSNDTEMSLEDNLFDLIDSMYEEKE